MLYKFYSYDTDLALNPKLWYVHKLAFAKLLLIDVVWLLHFPSNRRTIDYELLLSIDPKQSRHRLVIEGSNCTSTAVDLLCRKIEVLAHMAGIKVN